MLVAGLVKPATMILIVLVIVVVTITPGVVLVLTVTSGGSVLSAPEKCDT